MYKKLLIRYLYALGVSLLVSTGIGRVQARPPANVGLLSFTAVPQENGIRLDWETETELGTAGFTIKRSPGTSEDFITLDDIGFVSGQGGVATGATYSRVDETAVYGNAYTYKLVEIETDSQEVDLETAQVLFILDPTATPVVIGNDDPTITPTRTPVPTSTPSPTGAPPGTAVSPTATATSGPATATEATATGTPPPTAPSPSPTIMAATPQPTSTLDVVLDAPLTEDFTDSEVVLAQDQDATAYPGPASPTAVPDGTSLTGQPPATAPVEPTPYPARSNDGAPPTIAVIGGQGEDTPPPYSDPPPAIASSEIIRGRVFLWFGFIVALSIFIAGVVGSIVLYRRK